MPDYLSSAPFRFNIPNSLPDDPEATYLRDTFYEATRQKGHRSLVHQVASRETDSANDSVYNYSDPVETYLIFQEFPDRRVLRNLGWLNESNENQPIALLPTFYYTESGEKTPLRPVAGTKITFFYETFDGTPGDARDFEVSDLAADGPRVICWTARLVPSRIIDDFSSNVSGQAEDDNYYLNIAQERPRDR